MDTTTFQADPATDLHPALTLARLSAVAALEAEVRRGVAEISSRDLGDDNWNTSCTALNRRRKRFIEAAQNQYRDWLTIQDPSLHFVFRIGPVPLRVYTEGEDPEEAPLRHARQFPEELIEIQGAFEFYDLDDKEDDPILRLAVALDAAFNVVAIKLVRLTREAKVKRAWPVPVWVDLVESVTHRPAAVELEEPVVQTPEEQSKEDTRGA